MLFSRKSQRDVFATVYLKKSITIAFDLILSISNTIVKRLRISENDKV